MIATVLSAFSAHAREIEATGLYELPPADVVILGEIHDNSVHHAHQSIAVRAIGPKSIVFEMLTRDQADRVTPRLMTSEAAMGAVLGWEASGWPDFAMYYPVFLAASGAAVFGGDGGRDLARKAVRDGAATVFGAGAAPFGLDVALPEAEQLLREAEQLSAHCDALPEEMLAGLVEAQRLRDAWIARAAIEAFKTTGGPVVVITGNGHARTDWGVPRLLAEAAPDLAVISVGQYEVVAPPSPPFDFWLVTEPAERPDPCEAFR